jgi:hypothetical protein
VPGAADVGVGRASAAVSATLASAVSIAGTDSGAFSESGLAAVLQAVNKNRIKLHERSIPSLFIQYLPDYINFIITL